MAVLKPRERLVYFRISEDEFRQFVNVCEQMGARSMSDLARNAVQGLITGDRRQHESQALDEKMRVLEGLIAAVTEQLRILSAGSPPDSRLAGLSSEAGELQPGIKPHIPNGAEEA